MDKRGDAYKDLTERLNATARRCLLRACKEEGIELMPRGALTFRADNRYAQQYYAAVVQIAQINGRSSYERGRTGRRR